MMKNLRISSLMLLFASVVIFSACKDDDEPSVVAPSAPTLADATEITATSFTASWAAVTGADNYLLDVSTTNTFESFVEGYEKKEISTLTETVEGLEAETTYFFRVYARKGTLNSVASAVKEATTLEEDDDDDDDDDDEEEG